MRFLLLNQTFYPDVVSTAQHLQDLALGLVERGHEVSVIASRRAYDRPAKPFKARERWRGIEIYRLWSTGFGKGAKWKRAIDFATFILSSLWRLLRAPRPDVIVALTSPPLISFVGAGYARLTRRRFVYWVMDLNPDEAVAAGWLRRRSIVTRLLDRLSRFSLSHADGIVALDRFMAERIVAKGIPWSKVHTIPPWSHDDVVRFDNAERERFRAAHGLQGKYVVMYSGNHSPCHPLTTILQAARDLKQESKFMFLFVGGGSELPKVERFAREHQLSNIRRLPYQSLDELRGSLSAADLHLVVMGDPFVGMIHPCKIYNILAVQAPVLYVGPEESHVADIFQRMKRSVCCVSARHGDLARVIFELRRAAEYRGRGEPGIYSEINRQFSKAALLPRFIAVLESLGVQRPRGGGTVHGP